VPEAQNVVERRRITLAPKNMGESKTKTTMTT
jgi:hypothetical protein